MKFFALKFFALKFPALKCFTPKFLALQLIGFYRAWISPLFPPACRYHPTCSQYAWEAIDRFGLVPGGWLALKRILRCNPLFPGGYDPVPSHPVPANSVPDHPDPPTTHCQSK